MKFAVPLLLLALCTVSNADKPNLRGEGTQLKEFAAFLAERLDTKSTLTNPIPDPTCKKGVASPDLKACCTDECGSCGSHDLCNDPAAYNEKTGKLADNCCKDRVMKKAPSCDKDHPPCVLSPDYAKELKNYNFDRAKRHAMDDCNKAPEIARAKHALGVEKGEFFSKLYVSGKTKYEDALEIATKVDQLCAKKIGEIEDTEKPLKAQIAGAGASDKKVDQLTGISNVEKWSDELEQNQNEQRFYKMIMKNAKDVRASSRKGLKNVADLKATVQDKRDIGDFKVKLNALTDDAHLVFSDAELLWQQWLDSSKDYNCGEPPLVEHRASQCDDGNTKFSFKCAITCEEGYDGEGTKNALRCLKQGKFGKQLYGEWLGMATCVGRNCHKPPQIDKAKTVIQDIRYPNFAFYNCHEGHSVDSNPDSAHGFSVGCESTGNYGQNASHQCVRVKCGSAPPLKDTEKIDGTFFYTDVVNYKCLHGHTVDASPGGLTGFSIACQASGHFSSTQQCQRVRCGPPPDFTNTNELGSKDEQFYGDAVPFSCKPGYTLDQTVAGENKFTLMCGANGEFKVKGSQDGDGGIFPKCQPVSAGMSPKIEHGNLVSQEMFYGQEAQVSADEGYSYEQNPKAGLSFQLSVTTKGEYAGVREFLPVSCGAPPTITKAKPDFNKKKAVFGDSLPYKCEKGYSVDKTPTESSLSFALSCESDADFSVVPGLGECVNIDDCAQHTCGPHGECVDKLLNYTCSCNRGFEETKDEESGEKVCGNINDCGPEACGVGQCIDKIEGFDCECPAGYKVVGEGDDKTCKRKTCGIPPSVSNAKTSPIEEGSEKQFYESEVVYQCETGHTLNGKPGGPNHHTITCQANKQFTDTKACKPVQCESAPTVSNSDVSAGQTTFNKTLRYDCRKGYTLDGTDSGDKHFSVTCQTNGKYTDTQKCEAVSCGEPDEVPNSYRESGQVYFPAKRKYQCFEGFSLDGRNTKAKEFDVECRANGKLTKLSQCLPNVCGNPPKRIHALNGAAADEGPVAYPQVSEVTCRDGYTVGGDAKDSQSFAVSCTADGKFHSYDKRECDPVRCGAPPKFPNARMKRGGGLGGNLNFEETSTYECLPGFTAGGEHDAPTEFLVECLANGDLSYPPPDMQCRDVNACEQHTCGPRGTCRDVNGTGINEYNCKCEFGFEVQMNKGEKSCGNVDDCGDHQCGPGVCKDLIGDYTCVCPRGHYIGVEDGEKTCLPVRCAKEVPALPNGKMLSKHSGAIDFPQSLRFSCDKGYSIDGSVGDNKRLFHSNCKADGSLYGMMSCQKISCGTPRVLAFTKVIQPTPTSSIEYEEKVSYKCFEGYTIGGKADGKDAFQVKCQANGVISDPEVCEPVRCGRAPAIPKGRASLSGNVFYGQHLYYLCDLGYTLDGTAGGKTTFSRDCLKTGEFTGIGGNECKPKSAGKLPAIANAKMTEYDGTAVTSGEEVTAYYPNGVEYKCLAGYTLTGGSNGPTTIQSSVTHQGNLFPPLPAKCHAITFYAAGICKDARNGAGITGVKMTIGSSSANSWRGYAVVYGIRPGTYNVKYEKAGYISVTRRINIRRNIYFGGAMDISMSPSLAKDEWRAVLKWGRSPSDLDTYSKWGWSKACWYARSAWGGNMKAKLEKDDTNGYGPETMFFSKVGNCRGSSAACDIKYLINDYTRSRTMAAKGASVTLYTHTRVAGTWKIQDCPMSVSRNKNWWHVFTIDGRTNKLKWTCKDPPTPPVLPGLREEVFYFNQGKDVPILNGRAPNMQRTVFSVNYRSTSNRWSGYGKKDNFAVRWEGSLRVAGAGEYRFYLTSDDGSKMWIDEDNVVNNNGLHGMRTRTGTSYLPAGFHAIRIDFFERGGGGGCIFKYKGPDSRNRIVVVPSTVLRVNPVLGGLTEEVFYFNQGDKLANLNGRTPNQAREVDMVNYPKTSDKFSGFIRKDHFAARWTGFVAVRAPGDYTFYITSDDGSKLWLQDHELVNNDGLHGARTKSGTKYLTTGFHRVKMEMFEKGGGACAIFEYKGADSSNQKKVVPKSALRKAAGEPSIIDVNAGVNEEIFYFKQGDAVPNLNSYVPQQSRTREFINYPATSGKWDGFRQKDHFAVRWTGSVKVRSTGQYTFYLTSDDGSKMWIGSKAAPFINNDGLHGMRTKSGTRSVGALTAIRIDFFEKGGGAGCIFKFKGADTDNKVKVVPNRNLVKSASLSGLVMEVFYFKQECKLPTLAGYRPAQQKIVSSINYAPTSGKWSGFTASKDFAVRWTGYLVIRAAGNYDIYISSDDGSKVWLQHKELINNDGCHGNREKSGSRRLVEGEHALRVEFFQKGGGSACTLQYKGADTNNQKALVGTDETMRNAGRPKVVRPDAGLRMEAWYRKVNKLSDNLALWVRKPNLVRKDAQVNYPSTGNKFPGFPKKNDFVIRWTGGIHIEKNGRYTFQTESDDGSRLYIGNQKVVNNDGLHGMRKRDGKKNLNNGWHALRLEFFEQGGGAGMIFRYKGPDTNGKMEIVPQDVLKERKSQSSQWREERFDFKQGNRLKNLKGRKPNRVRPVNNIWQGKTKNKARFGKKNNFALRYTASLKVKKSGSYKFEVSSDDGAKLWVDYKMLVDNDGKHGFRARSASRSLSAGYHPLRVEFFEGRSNAGLKVRFTGPDTNNKWKKLGKGFITQLAGPKAKEGLLAAATHVKDDSKNVSTNAKMTPTFDLASKPSFEAVGNGSTSKTAVKKAPNMHEYLAAQKLGLPVKLASK